MTPENITELINLGKILVTFLTVIIIFYIFSKS